MLENKDISKQPRNSTLLEAKAFDFYDPIILCSFINLSHFTLNEKGEYELLLEEESDRQNLIHILSLLFNKLKLPSLTLSEKGAIILTKEQTQAIHMLQRQAQTRLIKTLRNDELFFADELFFPSITKSAEANTRNKPIRRGAHRKFTVSVDISASTAVERNKLYAGPYAQRPKLVHPQKKEFSKWQSTTLVMPSAQTATFDIFASGNKEKECLGMAGVIFDVADKSSVITQRLFIYEVGTLKRPYETDSLPDIEQKRNAYAQGKMFGDMETFKIAISDAANKGKYNEVFARLKWSCGSSAVGIFHDDFESRCLAQYFAYRIEKQLQTNGVFGYKVPIIYSVKGKKNSNAYTASEKLEDVKKANEIFEDPELFAKMMEKGAYNFLFLLNDNNKTAIREKKFRGCSLILYLVEMGMTHVAKHLFEYSGIENNFEKYCAEEMEKFDKNEFLFKIATSSANPSEANIFYLHNEMKDATQFLEANLPIGAFCLQGGEEGSQSPISYYYKMQDGTLLFGKLIDDSDLHPVYEDEGYLYDISDYSEVSDEAYLHKALTKSISVSPSLGQITRGFMGQIKSSHNFTRDQLTLLLTSYISKQHPHLFPVHKIFGAARSEYDEGTLLIDIFAEKNEVELIKAWYKINPVGAAKHADITLKKAIQCGSEDAVICLLKLHPQLVEEEHSYNLRYLEHSVIHQRDTAITLILLNHYEAYLKKHPEAVQDINAEVQIFRYALKADSSNKIKEMLAANAELIVYISPELWDKIKTNTSTNKHPSVLLKENIQTGSAENVASLLSRYPQLLTPQRGYNNQPQYNIASSDYNLSYLKIAVEEQKSKDVVSILLSHYEQHLRAHPNALQNIDHEILKYALQGNVSDKIKEILQTNPELMKQDRFGLYLWGEITKTKHENILLLIDFGANWKILKKGTQDTFVHEAVEQMQKGKNFSAQDLEMILMHILKKDGEDTNMAEFLNNKNLANETAAEKITKNIKSRENLHMLQVLFVYGADISNCKKLIDQKSPLAKATKYFLDRMQIIDDLRKMADIKLDRSTRSFPFWDKKEQKTPSEMPTILKAMFADKGSLHDLISADEVSLRKFIHNNKDSLNKLIDASKNDSASQQGLILITRLTTGKILKDELKLPLTIHLPGC